MKRNLRFQLQAALMAAALAVVSQFTIPIGTVPVTFQTIFIALTGALLGPLYGAISMVVYLALGAVGLPVFSGLRGGLGAFAGPTGGFLLAFPLMAALCGLGRFRPYWVQLISGFAGLIVLHTGGSLFFMAMTKSSLPATLAITTFPFLIKDVISIAMGALLGRVVVKRMASARWASTP